MLPPCTTRQISYRLSSGAVRNNPDVTSYPKDILDTAVSRGSSMSLSVAAAVHRKRIPRGWDSNRFLRQRHFGPACSDWMISRPTGSHSPASSSVTLNDTASMRPSTEVAAIMFSIRVSAASERNSSCTHSVPL